MATALVLAAAGCDGSAGRGADGTGGARTTTAATAVAPSPSMRTGTASGTPSPGGSPSTATGVPERAGVTFGAALFPLTRAQVDAALDDVVTLRLRWIRVDVSWAAVQPTGPGDSQWAALDRVVASARAHRLSVLGLLTYTPPWARSPGCGRFTCPPRDEAAFATFAGRVARRYGSDTVRAYQVWNEPNLGVFWPDPDPARYGRLLRATVTAVRAADPRATIVLGGLAYTGQRPGDIGPAPFVRQVCAGGGCRVDAVGYDPYTYPGLPSSTDRPFNAWQLIANPDTGGDELRAALRAVGLATTPVWVTGFGAPTGTGGRRVGDEQQARILVDALHLAAAARPSIGAVFLDTLRDPASGEAFGLVRVDGSRKPAFAAVRAALTP